MLELDRRLIVLEYNARRKTMVDYLLLKVTEEDWHGVSDAANDLRDIEAERLGYERALEQVREAEHKKL